MTGGIPAWGRALTIEQALFFAQDCCCFYCACEFGGPHTKGNRHKCWTKDHLLPRDKGHGRTRNIVLACGDCNAKKGNRPATSEQIERARQIHENALRLCRMFNGFVPPEWTGEREPVPTDRALHIARMQALSNPPASERAPSESPGAMP